MSEELIATNRHVKFRIVAPLCAMVQTPRYANKQTSLLIYSWLEAAGVRTTRSPGTPAGVFSSEHLDDCGQPRRSDEQLLRLRLEV